MTRICFMTCIALLILPIISVAQQQFEIETTILSYPTGQVVNILSSDTPVNQGQIPQVITHAPTAIQFGTGSQQAPIKLPSGSDRLDMGQFPKDVILQAAPRVTTVTSQRTIIMIAQYPQYLEKQDALTFRLRLTTDPDWVGVSTSYRVRLIDSTSNTFIVDATLQANWMESRETITNVLLDVGKPVIVHNHMEMSVSLDPEQWCVVSPPHAFGAADRSMLMLFKVRRVNGRGQPVDVNGRVLTK